MDQSVGTARRSRPGSNVPLLVGVGEVLWDLLPQGRQLGGAPANFAYHAHALGAKAIVVSRVGNDDLGREILSRLSGLGLPTEGIGIDPHAPTGTVGVSLNARGEATFTIHENVAWDFLEVPEPILRGVTQADGICFGTLGQRHPHARAAIRALVEAAKPGALRIFDINLRQHFWSKELILDCLKLADVLKLNDAELPVIASLLGLVGEESLQVRELATRFELKAVALTKGEKGSSLLVGDQLVSRPGSKLIIADTVGAGDSYTAALALGLLAKLEPGEIANLAHQVADYVCTQPGAMPPLPPDLAQAIFPDHSVTCCNSIV